MTTISKERLFFYTMGFLTSFFITSFLFRVGILPPKETKEETSNEKVIKPIVSDDITFISKDGLRFQFGYNLLIDWRDTTYSKLLKLEIQRHIYDIGHLHYAEEFSERKIDNITIDSKLFLQMQDTILWLGNHSLPCGLKDSDFTKLKFQSNNK